MLFYECVSCNKYLNASLIARHFVYISRCAHNVGVCVEEGRGGEGLRV